MKNERKVQTSLVVQIYEVDTAGAETVNSTDV
jgi:hypothetical protein